MSTTERPSTDDTGDDDLLRTQASAARRGFGPANAAMPGERSRDLRTSLRRLGTIVGSEKPLLAVATLFAVIAVTLLVIGPRMLGSATDIIVQGVRSGGIDTSRLHRALAEIGVVYLFAWVFGYGQTYLVTGALQRSMYRLRESVEAKLHRLPLSYIDSQSRGDLLSRVTNDIDNLSQSLQQSTSQMLVSVLTLVGTTVMMLTISPLLTLIAFVTVPVSIWVTKAIAKRARPRFIEQWRSTGDLNGQAEEVITGHAVVTTFGRQEEVRSRFDATNDRLYNSSLTAQFASSLMQPIMMFVGNLQFVTIAVVGGLQITSGAISIGGIQAMLQYVRQFGQPLQMLASMSATFQSGLASLERVVEFLDADEVSPESESEPLERPLRGRVVFEGVSFSYDPAKPLIVDLDLVAEPGQTVAIVGPTGAGKTTLVNLLLRFYELDAGRITLDGRDIASIPRRELRSSFGMVLQDTWLFGGTIFENLRYGNPEASDAEVLEAARVTLVDRMVHSLPEGYRTVINDEGDNVSTGQKQLITIARAYLADPAILILDEATSSVDTRTEVQIQEAMKALRANRTSFVIAHRLSTIRGADTIVVMDGGRIVEQGNHDELLERGGTYAALYQAQFAGQVT